MSLLHPYTLKGVEWGSLSSDEDEEVTTASEAKQDDEFKKPASRSTRRKQKQREIYVFSDLWDWTETPFQLQAIVSSQREMEQMVKRFKWAHGYCPASGVVWNFNRGKRSIHATTREYLERVASCVV